MCLERVESTERKPQANGKGWKVFAVNANKELESQVEGGIRVIGKWLMSDAYGNYEYPVGFHIFTNRKAAVKWLKATNLYDKSLPTNLHNDKVDVVRQVEWRDRLAIGTQKCWFGEYLDDNTHLPGKTIVAKEMMILA